MKKRKLCDAIYSVAFALIFGGALLADSLAELPHGFIYLFAIVGAAGVLVFVGNRLEYGKRR